MMKRLLSKNPKKARAAEDAKEKKRKEREAAASDREGRAVKKQATGAAKASANVKSAEFVHSSEENSSDDAPVASQIKEKPQSLSGARKAKPVNAASDSSSVLVCLCS